MALIELGAPDRNVAGVRTWRRAVTLANANDEIAVVIPRGSGALIAAAIDAGVETVLPVIGTSESPTGIDLLYTETDPAANWRLATILRIAARTNIAGASRLVIRPDLQGAPTLPAVVVVELETAERGALEDIANAYTDEAIGAGAAAQIAERYAVQKDLVDSTAHAAARVFSTIALAIAAGEEAAHAEIVVEPSPLYWLGAPRHIWNLASGGFTAASGLSVGVFCPEPFTTIELSGTAPAADGAVFPQIVFHGGSVQVVGPVDLGVNRQFSMRGVDVFDGNAHAFVGNNLDMFFDACSLEAPHFTTPGGGSYSGHVIRASQITHPNSLVTCFENSAGGYWANVVVNSGGTGLKSLIAAEAGGTAYVALDGVTINSSISAAGTRTLFDVGTGGTLTMAGVNVKLDQSGGGLIQLYNAGAIVLEASGFMWTDGVLTDLYGVPISGGGTDELAYSLTDLDTFGVTPTAWGAVDGGIVRTDLGAYDEYTAPLALGEYYVAIASDASLAVSCCVHGRGGVVAEVNTVTRSILVHDGVVWRMINANGSYSGTESFVAPPTATIRVVIAAGGAARDAVFSVSTDKGATWNVVATRNANWGYMGIWLETGAKMLVFGQEITAP